VIKIQSQRKHARIFLSIIYYTKMAILTGVKNLLYSSKTKNLTLQKIRNETNKKHSKKLKNKIDTNWTLDKA
jgi:hypothetical protein